MYDNPKLIDFVIDFRNGFNLELLILCFFLIKDALTTNLHNYLMDLYCLNGLCLMFPLLSLLDQASLSFS
jgi:hypothetical protein